MKVGRETEQSRKKGESLKCLQQSEILWTQGGGKKEICLQLSDNFVDLLITDVVYERHLS